MIVLEHSVFSQGATALLHCAYIRSCTVHKMYEMYPKTSCRRLPAVIVCRADGTCKSQSCNEPHVSSEHPCHVEAHPNSRIVHRLVQEQASSLMGMTALCCLQRKMSNAMVSASLTAGGSLQNQKHDMVLICEHCPYVRMAAVHLKHGTSNN